MPLEAKHKQQRKKNIALGLALVGFVGVIYYLAIVKMTYTG